MRLMTGEILCSDAVRSVVQGGGGDIASFIIYLLVRWEVEEFSRYAQGSLADLRGDTCARGYSNLHEFQAWVAKPPDADPRPVR